MKLKIITWYRLGLMNIATVAVYRLLKKMGYYRYRLPIKHLASSPIFSENTALKSVKCEINYFSFHSIEVISPPNWFINPYKSAKNRGGVLYKDHVSPLLTQHWSSIPDFMPELGDIKLVWELSRFDWLPKMAWTYKQGDKNALPLLELWVRDWINKNPVNSGLNWKCGQEASLRCLNLLLSTLIIDNCFKKPSNGLLSLLEAHAARITPTLRYAMAQDNNHGSSEAAALFVVGEYLAIYGDTQQKALGQSWAKKGRYWLENRVEHLVMEDGSFSQHSVTYHRLFLDSLSFVELIRAHLDIAKFSNSYYLKMQKATLWLYHMVDDKSGGAPNLGANDGAYLFNLENREYRDFRPSIQLSLAVFLEARLINKENTHPLLTLFNINTHKLALAPNKPIAQLLQNGGYGLLRKPQGFAMMRLPVFKFRPSHADAHHVDIWHKGINIIRDGGTYSYNTDDAFLQYFSGTASHSTIQFDGKDQMPRLGRFLFGDWLKPKELYLANDNQCIRSSYKDSQGAFHQRSLINCDKGWKVIDKFDGFKSYAVLRWRLAPDDWRLEQNTVVGTQFDLEFKSNLKISLKLLEADESLYYMHKQSIPVLEVLCEEAGSIETLISLH